MVALGAFVAAALFTPVAPAHACSPVLPPRLDDLVPGEPVPSGNGVVVGVYEFEHIARSPNLVVAISQSVSVVTRYWGTPPPHTGLQRYGPSWEILFGGNDCGAGMANLGDVGYRRVEERAVDNPNQPRSGSAIGGVQGSDGSVTAEQEAMLTERFGPPVVLGVSARDRVVSTLMAWQWHLVALVSVAMVIFAVLRWRRSPSEPAPASGDQTSLG